MGYKQSSNRLVHHSPLFQPWPHLVLSRIQQKKKTEKGCDVERSKASSILFSLLGLNRKHQGCGLWTSLTVVKRRPALDREETHARKMHFCQAVLNLTQHVQHFHCNSHLEGVGAPGLQVILYLSPVCKWQSCSSRCLAL